MYILYGSRSQQDARARLRRAASGAATPCCLSWARPLGPGHPHRYPHCSIARPWWQPRWPWPRRPWPQVTSNDCCGEGQARRLSGGEVRYRGQPHGLGDMAEQQAGGDANDDDEVQMLGEQTWQERDAAAREAAVEIDD